MMGFSCSLFSSPTDTRPAEQAPPEVIEEPKHKEASEDEDVMEAVARSRRRDAGLEALLERRQSSREAGPSNSDDEEVHPPAEGGLATPPARSFAHSCFRSA